jgi:sarcosine oxidase subunit alpha
MKPGRLAAPAGARIDRNQTVEFSFDGKRYSGFAGDTIASALLANGVSILSRSFKYHRPRGVLTAAGQDSNTLVQIGDETNVLADRRAIEPGMAVTPQNVFGSLESDHATWIGRFSRFLPVGFYYKAFYKPKALWPFWEKVIRQLAGLGVVNLEADHGYYDKQYLFADVAVVGGGPAGMAAALEAAANGAEVVLMEENRVLGGSLGYARLDAAGERADALRAELVAKVEAEANIRVLTSATCNGWFSDNWLPIIQGNRMYKLRATAMVVATGSYEQPMVFRNNDLPGVIMGSAAQRLIHQYGVQPGKRAVVVAANGDGYGVALDLLDAGVEVACVVDPRSDVPDCERHHAVIERGVPVIRETTVAEVMAAPGNKGVVGARIAKVTGEGETADTTDRFACDLICVSVGYHPAANLIYHARGRLSYDDRQATFAIAELPAHMFAAGSVDSAYDVDQAVVSGRHAGWDAARDAGHDGGTEPPMAVQDAAVPNYPWPIFPHQDGKDFVDFDEDLVVVDLLNAIAEGYDNIELLKRFSTVGMGPSQGRHSSLPSVRIAAKATGKTMDQTGTTTSRPPFTAETFGHLAGRSFEPVRHTAMHWRHLEQGARMMVAGQWMRPEFYGDAANREAKIKAEVMAVRENVGIIDVSTLGGIEVHGPDAAEFLNRMYTFAYLKQPVHRARYVLMTDQSGVITDDGVACRFHENHFYVTATTGGVGAVYQEMLFHNAQWRLDVCVINSTASYAGVNIAGPKARDVLARVSDDIDLSAEAFPYMGVRTGHIAGIPARLLRLGFVGELGYEVHVPASHGEALWDALMEAGKPESIRPFGIEAQRLLRLEKGHIIINQDTDGLTHPHEADMAWAIARKKPYFVGMRSIAIQNARGIERKLVGFTIVEEGAPAPKECHLVIRDGDITGRVTSVGYSHVLGKIIGIGYVAPDQAAVGTRFSIRIEQGRLIEAEVAAMPFYDPDGKRQEM